MRAVVHMDSRPRPAHWISSVAKLARKFLQDIVHFGEGCICIQYMDEMLYSMLLVDVALPPLSARRGHTGPGCTGAQGKSYRSATPSQTRTFKIKFVSALTTTNEWVAKIIWCSHRATASPRAWGNAVARDLRSGFCLEEVGLGGQRLVVVHGWPETRRSASTKQDRNFGLSQTDGPLQVRFLTSQTLPSSAGASWDSTTMTLVAAMSTTLVLIRLEVAT